MRQFTTALRLLPCSKLKVCWLRSQSSEYYLTKYVAGSRVEYLSPYPPDYNPIEKAFSVLKNRLRRNQALDEAEDVEEEIHRQIWDVITPELMRALYRSSGHF